MTLMASSHRDAHRRWGVVALSSAQRVPDVEKRGALTPEVLGTIVVTVETTKVTAFARVTATPAISTLVIPTVPVNHGEKLENSTTHDFQRWQQKMLFYLTTLGWAGLLLEEPTWAQVRGRSPISDFPPLTRDFVVSWEATLIKSKALVWGKSTLRTS
ncbi:hypothetical protein Acr_28g0004780 [Actinidia rufa]|uniref:Uncharacterized protein n=1 Tax=Actinidia rufa TaxID=165716 RepID=A0A7J0H9H6_9ERIC|nr:hypothetical protein Acr_28g0004780 [Actinidia rufa]